MEVAIRCVLIALFFGAMATGTWGNTRMVRRGKEAGYRYWLINPMSALQPREASSYPFSC